MERKRRYNKILVRVLAGLLILTTCFTLTGQRSDVEAADSGWTVGGSGVVKKIGYPTKFGATSFMLGSGDIFPTVFLLRPVETDTYAQKNGKKKFTSEIQHLIQRYSVETVAIIPYDFSDYLQRKGYDDTLCILKRAGDNESTLHVRNSEKYMKGIIYMNSVANSTDSCMTDGVFYNQIKNLNTQELLTKWKSIARKSSNIQESKKVWGYITRFDKSTRTYPIADRIDEYLHIDDLEAKGFDPNNIAAMSIEDAEMLYYRYIDFLMTVYSMIADSHPESTWLQIIESYIKGISETKRNNCSISITTGFIALGMTQVDGTDMSLNVIASSQDMIDAALDIESSYSMASRKGGEKIREYNVKEERTNTYYNRLLSSLELTAKEYKENNITPNRTYLENCLFGSPIVSRLLGYKPLFNSNGSIEYSKERWSDIHIIEQLKVNNYNYGANYVPAYTPPLAPSYKSSISSYSWKELSYVENDYSKVTANPTVEVDKTQELINDTVALPITINGSKELAKWEQIIDANKYFRIKVELKRTGQEKYPIDIDPASDKYYEKAEKISKDKLRKALKGKDPLVQYLDSSTKDIPIAAEETIKLTYTGTVTIYYSQEEVPDNKMNKIEADLNKATIKFKKDKDNPDEPDDPGNPPGEILPTGSYISEPVAFSELKEGTIYNETFEAMAGVPSTRTLYFASGGSEFMVEVEVQYAKDEEAVRTYRSYFGGDINCEFHDTDSLKGLSAGGTKTETFVADKNGKSSKKSVVAETSKVVNPVGAASYNTTVSDHNSSSTFKATWTGTISNSTSEPADIGSFDPGKPGNPCAGLGFDIGKLRTKAEPTTNWSVDAYNTALQQALTWATSMESTNSSFTYERIADSDGQKRQYTVGDAVITVTLSGGSNSHSHTKTLSYTGGTYSTSSVSSATLTSSDSGRLGSGWGWTDGQLGSGGGYVAGAHGHGGSCPGNDKLVTPAQYDDEGNMTADAVYGPCGITHSCGSFNAARDLTQGASSSISYKIEVTFKNGKTKSGGNYDGASALSASEVTVGSGLPAHALCGPCCQHQLPAVEDSWTQKTTFDTLKITDVRVWKIDSSYVNGMEEITYNEDAYVKATIKQGDPNIYYNIAASNTSMAGRLRYSLQQGQHDTVVWYEMNDSKKELRTDKCNGLAGTVSSSNPVKISKNQGHDNAWASGILYTNTAFGDEAGYLDKTADERDHDTYEYDRFDTRRNTDNTVTVISDMLILQTTGGDQSVLYFEAKDTKPSEESYDIEVNFETMWDNNTLSAAKWKENQINIGSYNGQYYNTTGKYTSLGDFAKIPTAFDNDIKESTVKDELGKARVTTSIKHKTVTSGNLSTPGQLQVRMTRPANLRIHIDSIRQNPVNPNQEYFPGQSYVTYKTILSYTSDENTGKAVLHEELQEEDETGTFGYTITSKYRDSDGADGNVNSIIVHDPVSTEYAMVISLPKEMDQRTTIPAGSAQSMLEELAESQVCPLSPSLCDYRINNCKYYLDNVKGSFDFETVDTYAAIEKEEESNGNMISDESYDYIYENFSGNREYLDVSATDCQTALLGENLFVTVTGEHAAVEVAVRLDAGDVGNAKLYMDTTSTSTTCKIWWSTDGETYPAENSLTATMKPGENNQIVEFALKDVPAWKEAGVIQRVKITLDGDGTGVGTFILSSLQFDLDLSGNGAAEIEASTGSKYDTTVLRGLFSNGTETMDYNFPSGFQTVTAVNGFSGFGTGRFLSATGTRISFPLADFELTYDKTIQVKMEANVYVEEVTNKDRMIFSLGGVGFYIPAGSKKGAFTTGNGVEKRAEEEIVGNAMKLGVVFSFGSMEECEVYINGNRVTNYTTITKSAEFTEDLIGSNCNIGNWNTDANFATSFYLDNFTVTRMAGNREHTASCYETSEHHAKGVLYQCENGGVLSVALKQNHVHTSDCVASVSEYNNHLHTSSCTQINTSNLQMIFNHASCGNGSYTALKNVLGVSLFDEFMNTYAEDPTVKAAANFTVLFEHFIASKVSNYLQQRVSRIPVTIGSYPNPILGCTGEYNTHVCNADCTSEQVLNCEEPHHSGNCYDYSSSICWDACGNDLNHKEGHVEETTAADGSTMYQGSFICLDNYFEVYFPNIGNFQGTGEHGISNTTISRGIGYVDNMSTLEWLREKRVKFGFDVLFNRNGIWEPVDAGEWVTLPIYGKAGNELDTYEFYCLLSNNEHISAGVEFEAEAINASPSPGGKEAPYLGDDISNMDTLEGLTTNKARLSSYRSYHSAHKRTYVDVVGRIGNLIIEDTDDLRYSNMFKENGVDGWLVEGVLGSVDIGKANGYFAWYLNTGAYAKDIRGVTVKKSTGFYNTYGTQNWMESATMYPLPLEANENPLETLKVSQLKLGYNILWDISTIGDYQQKVQVIPYFYALNTKTGVLTPVDVYIALDGTYLPVNYFGLMDEFVGADGNYESTYYNLKSQLYEYVMGLDWDTGALRRNYTVEEETLTKKLAEQMKVPVLDSIGNVLTYRNLAIPYGDFYSLGTLQMLLPEGRARTYIGSPNVNSVNINGSTNTNLRGGNESVYAYHAQRWHLTLGVPSSAVFVAYRNGEHILPTEYLERNDGTRIQAGEEFRNEDCVILMTADIKAIGDTYVLAYDQGKDNGVLTIDGRTFRFGSDIPTLLAVYDAGNGSSIDLDIEGTH